MELITAVVRPFKVDDVKDALKDLDVQGMTITEVKGFGRQGGHTETYRGAEYKVDLVPKVKIEIVASEDRVQSIIEAVSQAAQTGKIGDGKIWSIPVNSVMRIRTGELNADAL